MPKFSLSNIGKILLLGGLYYLSARLGLMMDAVGGVATSVWPPSGISLAALLLFGYGLWPGVAFGAFFANLHAGVTWPLALSIAVGNTLEVVTATLLLKRVFGFDRRLERLQDVIALFVGAAAFSTLISATVGVVSAWLAGRVSGISISRVWWIWWMGDMLGDLVIAPFLLTWSRWPRGKITWAMAGEMLLLLCGIAVVAQLSFGAWSLGKDIPYPIIYLIFIFVFWAALRFGPRGATAVVWMVTGLAIWDTVRGIGPFVRDSLNQSLFSLQFFIGILATTALVVAAVFMERRHAEEGIRKHALELQHLSQVKSEFASVVAHELKTPLTVIKEGIGMVLDGLDGEVNPQQAETLSFAKDNVDRLTRLIGNVLDYEKLESGKLALDLERVDLVQLVRETHNFMELIAKQKNIRLHEEVPERPVIQICDPDKIKEVLINLLDNSLKHTPEGGDVWIRLKPGPASVLLEVEDTGMGVPKEEQEIIFKMFRQATPQGKVKIPGAGIGLAVCKLIVELHHGRISVCSEPERGSKFTAELPTGIFNVAVSVKGPGSGLESSKAIPSSRRV